MFLQHFTLHHTTLLPYTLCMDMHGFTLVYIYIYIYIHILEFDLSLFRDRVCLTMQGEWRGSTVEA